MNEVEVRTRRLLLRPWRDADRDPFAAMCADPRVMEFFPSCHTRAESDHRIDYWSSQIRDHGWSTWAVELLENQEFIGNLGLSIPRTQFSFSPCVEVGWRLAHAHWGKGYATEGALASVAFGFAELGLEEIVSMTSLLNLRSQAVMERIGMTRTAEDFDHPAIPDGHPLKRHCLYRLSRESWRSMAPGRE